MLTVTEHIGHIVFPAVKLEHYGKLWHAFDWTRWVLVGGPGWREAIRPALWSIYCLSSRSPTSDRLAVASCIGFYVDWLHVGRPAHSEGKWLPVEPLWPISLPSGSWDCIKVRKVLMRKRQSEYLFCLLSVYLLDAQGPARKWVREEMWAEQPGPLQAGNWAHPLELAGPVFKSTHSTSPSKLSPVISDISSSVC